MNSLLQVVSYWKSTETYIFQSAVTTFERVNYNELITEFPLSYGVNYM